MRYSFLILAVVYCVTVTQYPAHAQRTPWNLGHRATTIRPGSFIDPLRYEPVQVTTSRTTGEIARVRGPNRLELRVMMPRRDRRGRLRRAQAVTVRVQLANTSAPTDDWGRRDARRFLQEHVGELVHVAVYGRRDRALMRGGYRLAMVQTDSVNLGAALLERQLCTFVADVIDQRSTVAQQIRPAPQWQPRPMPQPDRKPFRHNGVLVRFPPEPRPTVEPDWINIDDLASIDRAVAEIFER